MPCAGGFLFASGLERRAPIGQHSVSIAHGFANTGGFLSIKANALRRIGVVERRFFSSTTSLEAGEVVTKQFEGCARGSAKTVNGLVGIAHGEDVSFRAGEASEDLDLGEVGVLEFVGQDEAGPGARLGQTFVVVLQQIVGADDHVAEGAQILFPQPALQRGEYAGDFAAAAEYFGLLQDVL